MKRTKRPFFHYLLEYNNHFKENDVIYRRMAAQFGLSTGVPSGFFIVFVKPHRSPRKLTL